MTLPVSQKNGSLNSKNPGRDQDALGSRDDDAAEKQAPPKALNEELINRFKALIEGVTDQLMAGQDMDREAVRADAITLLIAAGQEMAATPAPAPDVSGVVVLMLKEEQKVREGNRGADLEKAKGPEQIFTFLRV